MTWMTLNTHRNSEDAEWLRNAFPVDLATYPHQLLGGELPTRALNWTVQEPAPLGWVDLSTGTLLLIEAIGAESLGGGTIIARLWVAPSNRIVELARPRRYTDDEYPTSDDHVSALEKLRMDIVERLPHTIIPGLTTQPENDDIEPGVE